MGGCDPAVSPFFAHVPYIDPSENPEQATYLKASNTGARDQFGDSVALSGGTLAVGAKDERSDATGVNGNQGNNDALNSGAVYVFTYAGGKRRYDAYLKASNTGGGDLFGDSVALSGNTLAVGATAEDSDATGVSTTTPITANNGASNSGAVYVFTRDARGTWTQQAYIKASNTGADDLFGGSVALSGDTLAVGAQSEDSAFQNSGAVYVFTRSVTTWTQQGPPLKASNPGLRDSFGSSVALSGDTLVVGAIGEDSDATGINGNQHNGSGTADSGAVYVRGIAR